MLSVVTELVTGGAAEPQNVSEIKRLSPTTARICPTTASANFPPLLLMAAAAGIGCVLSPACVVQSLKHGGAASSSGLILAGDRLEAIDGVRVASDAQARPLILGAIGTRVTLSLDRNGTK